MAMPLAATTPAHARGRASQRSTTGRTASTAPNCHAARNTRASEGGKVFERASSTPPTMETEYPSAWVSTTRPARPAAARATARPRDHDPTRRRPAT